MSSRPGPPRPVLVYRITHVENLPTLARRGGLHAPACSPDDELPYRPIHDESIRQRRGMRLIPCGPGGAVDDYVSFYLGPRSPMLYRISRRDQGDQRSVVYLVSSVEKLQGLDLRLVFSDGHGLPALTRWYDDAAKLEALDWEAILSRFWFDTKEDPDRCRRKQAECLVHGFVPWNALLGIAVADEGMLEQVEDRLRSQVPAIPRVRVRPDWYYDE